MKYIRKCATCGKEFETDVHNRITCSELCAKERVRIRDMRRRDTRKSKKNITSIDEVNAAAKKQGLSYGQYKARLYMESIGRLC